MTRPTSFASGTLAPALASLVAAWLMTAATTAAPEEAPVSPANPESAPPAVDFLPLSCTGDQTGGFHDYPDDDQSYVPALFNATSFRLEENRVFMLNLGRQPGVDLFVSLTAGEDPVTTELECRQVRGVDGSPGFSCVNIPPSEMLLLNSKSLRFTRTAVGGWTFAGATEAHSGDSIFVEYGTCTPVPAQ